MVTVYTKEALKQAVQAHENHILVKGELAKTIKKKIERRKNLKKVGAGLIIGGAIAAPFTGGTSMVIAMGLTAGPVVISTLELALLLGCTVAIIGLLKGYKKIKFNLDGSVVLERE